jgi:hypothetical protein
MTLSIDHRAPVGTSPGSPIPLLRSSSIPHAEREVQRGTLVRVRRGVLASATLWAALPPWDRYTARVHAVTMTHPDAVLCLESAAVMLGLPVVGEPRDVHVLDGPGGTARLTGGIRLHTTAGDRAIIDLGGVLVTSVLETTVDLARSRHPAVGLATTDAALRAQPWLSIEALVVRNESRRASRGRRHARWSLHRGDPLAETALESLSRAAIEWLGFEEPELQRVFRSGGSTDRTDMWWPDQRVIGEADGDLKYNGTLQDPPGAIRREKARDARLREHASAIAHWGWADVARIAPLRAALHHAGLQPIRPESSPELHSLSSLMRGSRAPGPENAPERPD